MAVKIYLYDNEVDCIGSGSLSSTYVQWQLEAAGGQDVEVHISSVGGSAFDALAIYNLLKQYAGKVTTHIDALAASAASIVAMAGQTVYMSKYALLMIHKPMVGSGGNADDLASDISMLNKVQEQLCAVYVSKTGLSEDKIEALINETTWLSSDEAKTLGFIDVIEDYQEENAATVKNATLVSNFVKTAPERYKLVINTILDKPAPATTQQKMTPEEIEAITKPTNVLLKKIVNYLFGSSTKIVTNKGDKFVVGNFAEGAKVFNDSDMEDKATDEEDVEATMGDKKVKMSFKDGVITNIKKMSGDNDGDEDDDDIDADNKVVLNSVGVSVKKSLGHKAIKNSIAAKLKEVTNKTQEQNNLIVELTEQLRISNLGLQKKVDDVKNEIITEFSHDNSQRTNRSQNTNGALPSWAKTTDGSVAANATKKAINKTEKV